LLAPDVPATVQAASMLAASRARPAWSQRTAR